MTENNDGNNDGNNSPEVKMDERKRQRGTETGHDSPDVGEGPERKPKASTKTGWEGEPVAPPKAHILFSNDMKEKLRDQNPTWTKRELHQVATRLWKEASEETKKKFATMAEEGKTRYDQEYEAWWGRLSDEKRKIERAKAEAKSAVKPKKFALKGGPAGLTKDQTIRFMQEFIPRHYLEGETLAWRELIEPMLRERYPELHWEGNPDPAVDKSSLIRSMKSIWKEVSMATMLPASLDQLDLDEEERAKVSVLEPYITSLIADIEASRKSEEAARNEACEKLVQAEERTLTLEKFACETLLVWWCLVTRKPSLYALGTDMNAFGFVAGVISKHWFPSGAPGRTSTDWDAMERDHRKQQPKHWKKPEPEIPKETQRKLKATVVKDANGNEKIVWVVQEEEPVAKVEEDPHAVAKAREAAELALTQAYTVKIEHHLKGFARKLTSVDEGRLKSEVLGKVGLGVYPDGWHPPVHQ